jgi:hypothetical protein
MSKFNKDGYARCSIYSNPDRFDTYLVKTQEGCYDFAHFANDEWNKGVNTDGTPLLWREIPHTDED